jgi:O-acetyl-ADP-ribose deacetylase (regulator of RNase III)
MPGGAIYKDRTMATTEKRTIEQHQGDLFTAPAQTIVCPVNTVGTMGKGLAADFARRFPGLEEAYRRDCKAGRLTVEHPTLYKQFTPWVLCFPTKMHYRDASQLEWIAQGLIYFTQNYQRAGITSIAWPRLGCGEGRLTWEQVEPMMLRYLGEVAGAGRCQVQIYHLPAAEEAEGTEEPGPTLFFFTGSQARPETHGGERGYAGPYPPPDRACYVCQCRAWVWTGEGYQCGSGDPAHAERERDLQEHPERYYA